MAAVRAHLWLAARLVSPGGRDGCRAGLLAPLGGLGRGAQTTIAAVLGVHRSTISKDLKRLMPLTKPCPSCGLLQPRRWLEDEAL